MKYGKTISYYSQLREDLIIRHIFDLLHIKKPSYLDIGAHHPYHISNTALLYENGSRGINIEPDPVLFSEINKVRKKDINLNFGIGEKDDTLDFYMINASTLNTFSKKAAESYHQEGDYFIEKIIKIPVKTLDFVLDRYYDGKFPDFLSLDAEGIDEMIIKSIDYNKHYPTVICVETRSFSTSGNGVKDKSLIDFVINRVLPLKSQVVFKQHLFPFQQGQDAFDTHEETSVPTYVSTNHYYMIL